MLCMEWTKNKCISVLYYVNIRFIANVQLYPNTIVNNRFQDTVQQQYRYLYKTHRNFSTSYKQDFSLWSCTHGPGLLNFCCCCFFKKKRKKKAKSLVARKQQQQQQSSMWKHVPLLLLTGTVVMPSFFKWHLSIKKNKQTRYWTLLKSGVHVQREMQGRGGSACLLAHHLTSAAFTLGRYNFYVHCSSPLLWSARQN